MLAHEGMKERSAPETLALCLDAMLRVRDRVDARLAQLTPRAEPPGQQVAEAIEYSLLAGGKRLRPVLAMLTAHSLGADTDQALDPACAVEMVHTASLILDDLPCMDDAATRRGRPANHRVYGEAVASLAAVALISEAFGVISRSSALSAGTRAEITQILSNAIGLNGLTSGQASDLQGVDGQDRRTLERMETQKTGTLFVASVQIGARVAGADSRVVRALTRYAGQAGLAFQIFDDLLDSHGDGTHIGKDVRQDGGKATFSSLLGREAAEAKALRLCASAVQAVDRLPRQCEMLEGFLEVMIDGYRQQVRVTS